MPANPSSSLETFHPLVRRWFGEHFAAPTDAQAKAWPLIAAGEHVLVSAPTGSGNTLTAFLSAIDHLRRRIAPPPRRRGSERQVTPAESEIPP